MAKQRIIDAYRWRFPGSAALYDRALQYIPSGINHDVRHIPPFPVYIERAAGARKWDVDGNEFIDFADGHGALILGHSHPALVHAMQAQASTVTHASAPTPHEVRWAELVHALVPSAERVRFVLSGTEATMLAMRLARAHTNRSVIVRLEGHFHGWHDYAMSGLSSTGAASAGIPGEIDGTLRSVPSNDLAAMERALGLGDVAGVILEPDGPSAGTVPVDPMYLHQLRELTRRYGVPLIFDEVVTGFRLAPGGAQEYFGVVPDLSTFAKAIAGGVPSGAVAGRADIMQGMALRADPEWNLRRRVRHTGTYNANPLAAAVGSTALAILQDGSVQDQAAGLAERLRRGLNAVMQEARVAGCSYGLRSCFRVIVGDAGDLPDTHDPAEFLAAISKERLLTGTRMTLRQDMQRALLVEGVDLLAGNHGWLSQAHTARDVDLAVEAFGRALAEIVEEGGLRPGRRPSRQDGPQQVKAPIGSSKDAELPRVR